MTDSFNNKYKWFAFISVAVGVFMSTLDASIVNIGLPIIREFFDTSLPTVQWVVMSYLLSITSVLLTLGRLGDMIGRKKVYIIGIVVFTSASVLCGLAPSIIFLIVSRAVQGLGASMIMAMGPAITTSSFPASERGRALGLIGTVVASGLTFGPAIGGYIIKYLGWRWMFYVNLPIGIAGVLMISKLLKESEKSHREKFDIPGAAFLFFSLISILLALSYGREWGWLSGQTLLLFAGFIGFTGLFLWWERLAPNPIFHLELFSNRTFTAASVTAWISFVSLFGVSIFMPFYLTQVIKLSVVTAGQVMLIFPAAVSFIAPVSGWLSDRIGVRLPTTIGLTISTIGLVALSRLGVHESVWDVSWRLLLTGIGSGMFQSPNSSAIMGSVPRNMLGVASGTVAMMRNLGMVSGVAIMGAVVAAGRSSYLEAIEAPTAESAAMALVFGLRYGFLTAAVICAVGVVISAFRK